MNFSYAHANMSCNENGFFKKFYYIELLNLFYLYTLTARAASQILEACYAWNMVRYPCIACEKEAAVMFVWLSVLGQIRTTHSSKQTSTTNHFIAATTPSQHYGECDGPLMEMLPPCFVTIHSIVRGCHFGVCSTCNRTW